MKPRKKPWVNLAVFESQADAQTLETFLQHQRFEARTHNDRLLQAMLFLCPPHATYRVQVRSDEFTNALHFLKSGPYTGMLLTRAIQCPSCGSTDIQYPQMTRRFILPTILLHLGIIFRIIEHEAYCEHCHFIWNLTPGKVPEPPKPVTVGNHH
jgi:hypothetical protein